MKANDKFSIRKRHKERKLVADFGKFSSSVQAWAIEHEQAERKLWGSAKKQNRTKIKLLRHRNSKLKGSLTKTAHPRTSGLSQLNCNSDVLRRWMLLQNGLGLSASTGWAHSAISWPALSPTLAQGDHNKKSVLMRRGSCDQPLISYGPDSDFSLQDMHFTIPRAGKTTTAWLFDCL